MYISGRLGLMKGDWFGGGGGGKSDAEPLVASDFVLV
jgi:hypothetical protein